MGSLQCEDPRISEKAGGRVWFPGEGNIPLSGGDEGGHA